MSLKPTKDPEIKVDQRTGIHYYRGTPVKGAREIVKSLGVRNYRTAIQAKREYLWSIRGVDPSEKGILFRDYVKTIFLAERRRKAKNTFELAFYCCNHMLPFFETYTMRQINDRVWDEYVEYAQQISPGRKLGYDRRHMLMMLKRLHKKGLVRDMPELYIPEEKPKRRRVLNTDEVSAIFKTARGTIFGLALIVYKMGARPGEVLGAKWIEFDLAKGIWHIPAERIKTRVGRSIAVNPEVMEYLNKRRAEAEKSEFVFPTRENPKASVGRYNKQWDRMLSIAKLDPEITPYFLRHTFLTEAAKKVRSGKLSLVMITKYAGTSIDQFERTYLHIDGEDTREVSTVMDLGEVT